MGELSHKGHKLRQTRLSWIKYSVIREVLPTLQVLMTLIDSGQTVKTVTGTSQNKLSCLRQVFQFNKDFLKEIIHRTLSLAG